MKYKKKNGEKRLEIIITIHRINKKIKKDKNSEWEWWKTDIQKAIMHLHSSIEFNGWLKVDFYFSNDYSAQWTNQQCYNRKKKEK